MCRAAATSVMIRKIVELAVPITAIVIAIFNRTASTAPFTIVRFIKRRKL
jgi:hypothetical protein